MPKHPLLLLIALAFAWGCGQPHPTAFTGSTVDASVGGAPKFWEHGAAVSWNELADRCSHDGRPAPCG
jgi:hypothetical protein